MRIDYKTTEDGWFAYEYKRASMTSDNVIFGFDGTNLNVLLIKRGERVEIGKWALPGGFLRMDETIEECAARELREETGLAQPFMQQFGVFSAVDRDPQARVVTVGFYALVKTTEVQGGDDAREARWFPLSEVPALAFDHDQILRVATQRLREDLHFRPVGFELLPEEFTMPQLQRLYEAILGIHFDRRNFIKKMLSTGILEDTGKTEDVRGHRPASLYRFCEEQYHQLKKDGTLRLEF